MLAEPGTTTRRLLRHVHLAGWMDLLGTAVSETAPRVQRIHFQIADRIFDKLGLLPPAQPVVCTTRFLHHRIATLTYASVRYSGAGVSYLARQHFDLPAGVVSGEVSGTVNVGVGKTSL